MCVKINDDKTRKRITMKNEHNATPKLEASPLSSCELSLEDLEFVSRELLDEELEVVVGGVQRVPLGHNTIITVAS